MKNILSYKLGTPFTGKEIKEWTLKNIDNMDRIKRHMAKRLMRFLTISDIDLYYLTLTSEGTSCGTINRYCPCVVKCNKV